jgi:pimeloyl-[acyl-carrier protein] synthase
MSYSFYSRSTLQNPYELYQKLRENDPVYWSSEIHAWVISTYQDIDECLCNNPSVISASNTQFFLNTKTETPELQMKLEVVGKFMSRWITNFSGKKHKTARQILFKGFNTEAIEILKPRINSIIEDLLNSVEKKNTFDFINDFAHPLPVMVVGGVIGFPVHDKELFLSWSARIANFLNLHRTSLLTVVEDMFEVIEEIENYLGNIIRERKKSPERDILSNLIALSEADQDFTHEDLVSNIMFLFFAGHESTTNLLANGLLALIHHPQQMNLLRNENSLMNSAVEEFFRYDSPIQYINRCAGADMVLRGKSIKQGQRMILLIGSANRDPNYFDSPEEFKITRANNKHLSFGKGSHFCIGSQLARLEANLAINCLLKRYKTIELATQEVKRKPGFGFRGPSELPLVVRENNKYFCVKK